VLRTVAFISNFLNHHQLPFCQAMRDRLGEGFRFIATEPVHSERIAMGYENMNEKYPFVVRAYETPESYLQAMRLADDSDLAIIGSAPEKFIQNRLKENRITFRYSERLFKKGVWRIVDPRILRYLYLNHYRYRNQNLYMLCASAYTAGDYSMAGCYKNKTFKWGYFPEGYPQDIRSLLNMKRKNNRVVLLWVGRLLALKHPEKAIRVAEWLKMKGVKFELQMIGQGEQEEYIREMVAARNLSDEVKMYGFMHHQKVREYMERADIFLFTSDYQEGWGAVLNEAMNSGCAVVASHAIGSVPFLVDHGKNGLIFKNNNLNDLCEKVETLSANEALREKLGIKAYQTLSRTWNAENAAENLINLYAQLCNGMEKVIVTGPCSPAKPIPQRRMYSHCIN